MAGAFPIALAAGTGLVSGFVVSIPVGPINVTIVNEGSRRGFLWAFLIGLGAVTMDLAYCTVAFAGLAELFESRLMRATMELLSFLLMLYLGLKYLRATSLPATTRSVDRVEHRLHPHTAFMTGFVRVLGNPGVLLFWITLSATLISHEWVADNWTCKIACLAGIALGALTWFLFISLLVSYGHGKFSNLTLLRLSRFSGACLLAVALVIGVRLVVILSHRRNL